MTVGYANVSNGGTLCSICPPTCQVTQVHPISWSAELRSLHTCRDLDVVPYCVRHVHHQRALTIFVLSGSRLLLRPQRTRFCLGQSTFDRGHSFTVAQLPRPATFCVESQRVHTLHQSIVCQSWKCGSLIFYTAFTLSTLPTPSRTTTNTYYNAYCTIVCGKFSIYTGSGAETHGK